MIYTYHSKAEQRAQTERVEQDGAATRHGVSVEVEQQPEVAEAKKSPPEILWYYTTLETFKQYIDNFLNGELYFNDRGKFNDPMEGILMEALRIHGYASMADTIENKLQSCKVLCLTGNPSNSAMWAHYAERINGTDRQQGVCVGIRLNDYYKNCIFKINYEETLPVGEYTVVCQQLDEAKQWQLAASSLSYKFKSWEYEDEWRLIIKSENAKAVKIGNLEHIILGFYKQEEARSWFEQHKRWTEMQPKMGAMMLVPDFSKNGKASFRCIIGDQDGISQHLYRALVAFNNQDYDGAIANNMTIVQSTQGLPSGMASYCCGIAYFKKGSNTCSIEDLSNAIRYLTKAFEIVPKYPLFEIIFLEQSYYKRGYAYYNKGEYEKAIADFAEIIRLKPDNSDYQRALDEAKKAVGK